jgi:ribosomal protein S12 methylthiotransferase
MVGFPGETEAEFAELKKFVAEQQFEHLGCFTFSQEEGTLAYRMPDQIDEKVKEKRRREIMVLQKKISRQRMKRYVNTVQEVLVKGLSDETDLLAEGRLATQAPEVDGVVYINDGDFKPGTIQRVRITEAHDYDLVGHILEE